jgi:signal transduction histidine kinase
METRKFDVENENFHRQLNASYALSGYLLEAHSEQAVILAGMKVSTELLDAEGSVFVPFNEWQQSVPALKYGLADIPHKTDWQERLSAPATRNACRICEKKRAGSECVLLQGSLEGRNIFCVSLRAEGREIGLVSYFFSVPGMVSEDQHLFLAEMVRLTGLALEGLKSRSQEVEAARLMPIPQELKEKYLALDAQTEELLQQLEYKAVLDERTRLAREIHDGLAQTLAFLKMEAARMQGCVSRGDIETVARTLEACHKTLSEAYLDARQAIDDLRHVPEQSLGDWLESTAGGFKTLTGIEVNVSNVRLYHVFLPSAKAQLVRIVQEALTNVRKHAQACEVTLSAFERGEAVILEIRDDGIGFAPEETQTASQYGLRSMRERAESIGADFQITSTPGGGTVVRLEIPIREKAGL